MFVLRNPTDNENDRYISYQPKYNASLTVNKHYNDSFEELSLDIHEMYFKPDIVAIINKFDDIYNIANEFLESDLSFYKQYEEFMTEYLMCSIEDRMGVFFDHAPMLINHIDMLFDKSHIEDQLMVKQDSSYKLNITLDLLIYSSYFSVDGFLFIVIWWFEHGCTSTKVIHNMLSRISGKVLNKFFQYSNFYCRQQTRTTSKIMGLTDKIYLESLSVYSLVYITTLPSIQTKNHSIFDFCS